MPESSFVPGLEFVLELRVSVGSTLTLGAGACGVRRTVPILGGNFHGPRIGGRVLPGGADWQFVEADGLTRLDAHYAIETDDGVCIELRNQGLRHGSPEVMQRLSKAEQVSSSEYYFRSVPQFFAPDGKYAWMRRSIFVASGERFAELVVVRVWAVS